MSLESINLDEILYNNLIQLVLKELINEWWLLYDRNVIFIENWVFSEKNFNNFLKWLDNWLNKKWTFTMSYKDISRFKNEIKISLENKYIDRKFYKFFENIWDHLDREVIKKNKNFTNDKEKIIAKEWIQKYLLNSINNIDTIDSLMKLFSY